MCWNTEVNQLTTWLYHTWQPYVSKADWVTEAQTPRLIGVWLWNPYSKKDTHSCAAHWSVGSRMHPQLSRMRASRGVTKTEAPKARDTRQRGGSKGHCHCHQWSNHQAPSCDFVHDSPLINQWLSLQSVHMATLQWYELKHSVYLSLCARTGILTVTPDNFQGMSAVLQSSSCDNDLRKKNENHTLNFLNSWPHFL